MEEYYSKSLNANRLQKCYQVAPKRIQQLLEAEIDFVIERIGRNDAVLDLGCGYGRVSTELSNKAAKVVGIDISEDNIQLAKELNNNSNCEFHTMNAIDLKFENDIFDMTICIQNGISAFKVSPEELVIETIRVTKKGGVILFSSYSENIWKDRLNWFEIQAKQGLIGEIDYKATKNGNIVCKDGFTATTFTEEDFDKLASNFNVDTRIYEVDNSSVFCEMIVN
jgi:2-polyprenyl-6-hydroxyphenyl methylase/3-demethylubiquinone-9 3-methyltransferase